MNWPEAVVAIVAMAGTLIWLACTNWYWADDAPPQSQDDVQRDWEAAKTAQRLRDNLNKPTRPSPRLPDPYPPD